MIILNLYTVLFVLNMILFQHCKVDSGSFTKDLSFVHKDLSSIIILDNSPGAYKGFPGKWCNFAGSSLTDIENLTQSKWHVAYKILNS